jgi:hypothetical protein
MAVLVALVLLAAAGPVTATAKLLPRVDGWKLESAPATYSPDSLFEYVDGGADAFLQFDFEELTSATYVKTAKGQKLELVADLYRQRDPARAFGIYSQERRPGSTKMPGPLEGIASPDHLEFIAGDYYVKLALPAGGDANLLPMFADKIAANLPGPRAVPAVLASFPAQGKQPRAEKLTARNFLGHTFLHDAAAVPYEVGGARFRLFAVEGKDAADVRAMVTAFRKVAKAPVTEIAGKGAVALKDPLNGEVSLAWSGRWLWGAVDAPSPARQALVDELGRNLAAR